VVAIVETKRRNPRFGYQRIADQIALAFDIPLDKDTVHRELRTRRAMVTSTDGLIAASVGNANPVVSVSAR